MGTPSNWERPVNVRKRNISLNEVFQNHSHDIRLKKLVWELDFLQNKNDHTRRPHIEKRTFGIFWSGLCPECVRLQQIHSIFLLIFRRRAAAGAPARRWRLLAVAAQRAFAATLLDLPVDGAEAVDGDPPVLEDVLLDARLVEPPVPRRVL